jgi:hypothetical protein
MWDVIETKENLTIKGEYITIQISGVHVSFIYVTVKMGI